MFGQEGGGIRLGPAGLRQGVDHRGDLRPAALGEGVGRPPLPLLPVGGTHVVIDHPHIQGAGYPIQNSVGRHLSGGVVVGADVGAHLVGVHAAVDGYDLEPGLGGGVNGSGIFFLVNGGKHNGLRPGPHRLRDQPVLGLVVLLRLRTGDAQL